MSDILQQIYILTLPHLALPVLGAALAVGLAGFGSATGISIAGQVADGALADDPDKFGNLLILVALPGTQGIYGFLGAFLILLKSGFIGGAPNEAMTIAQGWMFFFAGLPVGLGGWVSGIYQGKVCATGVSMAVKRPEAMMKGVIYGAMVETYSILGLLITILALNGINLQ
ncbi:MAG: V-type ATP synthase subunit K [Deltaproteobacteria bacterium]|nr:V-type ATP synthase subunit K [Candidatus Zymogenaceae bacterium]